jgi:prevent-host-death family protein
MLKKISAIKARQNLGQLLNEVSIKGGSFIIERAGKPLAALVDLESLQKIQEDRDSALAAVGKIWSKMEGADVQEVTETIDKAIGAARKVKKVK